MITETWLNNSVSDSVVINNSHYSIFRTDRLSNTVDDDNIGGGVCIIFNTDTVKLSRINLPQTYSHIELSVADIVSNHSKITRLFVAYRPPGANREPSAVSYTTDLCTCIENLLPLQGSIIIVGDFNFPSINWQNDNCIKCNNFSCVGIFLTLHYKLGLQQFVQSPTRNNNILDLILSNDSNGILNVEIAEPFSTSDHNSIIFDILIDTHTVSSSPPTRLSPNFNRADWEGIRSFLYSLDYGNIFCADYDIELVCENFYRIISFCVKNFVPFKCIKLFTKHVGPRYPASVKKLLTRKRAAWRAHRSKPTTQSRVYYNRIAAESRRAVRSFIRDSENNLVNNGNLNMFFRYANKKFSCKSSVSVLRTANGQLSGDSHIIAETLKNTFSSFYVSDNSIIPPITNHTNTDSSLSSIVFTTNTVRNAIKKLKARSSGGPDGIPPIFYKKLTDVLCYPLAKLFNACFDHKYLPPVWKRAFVTPIFKKGCRTDPNNYRPIALTCTMCKLMESVIKTQMTEFLSINHIISPHQHAFLSNHSTTTNLLECINDWVLSLQSHHSTDIVYVDFSRAFDSIVFSKLMYKLEKCSITGKLHGWIKNFVSNRTQCVVVNYNYSSDCNVLSGVPQGSILGPILFLLYINDIDTVCSDDATVKLFADDCKLYSEITLQRPSILLQNCLDRLCLYSSEWQLSINVLKCYVLSTCRQNYSRSNCVYFINGCPIANTPNVVDLGICISEDLSPKLHVENIVARAEQRVSIFFRGFISRDFNIVRKVFITYIRPILEYNSVIWNPSEIYLIDLIERVQRSYTKRIQSLSELSYQERLAKLKLESLEFRRLKFDLIYYYKILNHLTPLNPNKVFMIYQSNPITRSEPFYLQKPTKSTERIISSFFYRNIAAWNKLPVDIKTLDSVCRFKSVIKTLDFTDFLKGSMYK